MLRKDQAHTRKPTPAISSTTLATDHIMFSAVGLLSISGSCGQLLVYVAPVPPPTSAGRSVAAAQAVQKKKPAICARRSALGRVFSFMA
ncbi:hypothetical protein D9M68_943610 [compost metagenome]